MSKKKQPRIFPLWQDKHKSGLSRFGHIWVKVFGYTYVYFKTSGYTVLQWDNSNSPVVRKNQATVKSFKTEISFDIFLCLAQVNHNQNRVLILLQLKIHSHTNYRILLTTSRFNCWYSCTVLRDHLRTVSYKSAHSPGSVAVKIHKALSQDSLGWPAELDRRCCCSHFCVWSR